MKMTRGRGGLNNLLLHIGWEERWGGSGREGRGLKETALRGLRKKKEGGVG